jgi:hypothetical protein
MTARKAKRPRKDDDVIADIAEQLRPWRKGKAEAEISAEVSQTMGLVRRLAPDTEKLSNAGRIRKAAEDARRAFLALESVLPGGGFYDIDFAHVRKRIEFLTRGVKGPAPQSDPLGWLCAHQAGQLVIELSDKKPVTSQAGNVHIIAQLISEAVTGIPLNGSEPLRAVKTVIKPRRQD